jgi:hypothetical protein
MQPSSFLRTPLLNPGCSLLSRRDDSGESEQLWISVSYVCRRWRAAAFALPQLWTRLYGCMPHPLWDSASLRSGAISLHIILGNQGYINLEILTATHSEQYRGRVESPGLDDDVRTRGNGLSKFFGSIFLSLQRLVVGLSCYDHGSQRTLPYFSEAINFPKLTKLRIIGSPFPWDHSVYTSIENLTLNIPIMFFPKATQFCCTSPLHDMLGRLVDTRSLYQSAETARITAPSLKTLLSNDILSLLFLACISPSPSLIFRVDASRSHLGPMSHVGQKILSSSFRAMQE